MAEQQQIRREHVEETAQQPTQALQDEKNNVLLADAETDEDFWIGIDKDVEEGLGIAAVFKQKGGQ